LIPSAVGLAFALGIVTPGRFAEPSLLEEFGAQFADGGVRVDLDLAEETEALADGASRAEFT
jgi:hypothetical protein